MGKPEARQSVFGGTAVEPTANPTASTEASISRRLTLQRKAVVGGPLVWVTPAVPSVIAKSAAASSPPPPLPLLPPAMQYTALGTYAFQTYAGSNYAAHVAEVVR